MKPIEHWKNLSLENLSEIIDGEIVIERWENIPGWETFYKSSSFGRIKSLYRVDRIGVSHKERIMKCFLSAKGYIRVCLSRDGGQKKFQVHRLVALSFFKNPLNKPHVNHIRGIKYDNRSSQLEWATRSEDEKHSYKVLGKKANAPWAGKKGVLHFRSQAVIQFDANGSIIAEFGSISLAKEATGSDPGGISLCIRGKQPFCNGFIWRNKQK